MKTIEIGGRLLEDSQVLMDRLGISRMSLWRLTERGLPKAIKIGKYRFYHREAVDDWLLSQTEATISTA